MPLNVLETERKKHLFWATVNRPAARNSVNFELMDELESVLDLVEDDQSIRVFILSGSGRDIFISGGDLKEFHAIRSSEKAKPMARRMLAILKRIELLPCWTICCINGAAYGGGCETMLAFDFRIASSEATFGFTQGRFYLPPGWGGLTRLVEQVGRSHALQWLAEAEVIDAETALDHQLINRIANPETLKKKTWDWAEKLAKNDRPFITTLKEGALRFSEQRWKAIESELEPFSKFWEDERHHQRVEDFLNRKNE